MDGTYAQKIEEFLNRHGISSYHFQHRSKHPAVVVELAGKVHRVFFSASGSDWRGPANAIRDLRHELGLVNCRATGGPTSPMPKKPKSHKPRRPRPIPPRRETPVPRIDKFYAPLMLLRERMAAEASAEKTSATREPARISLETPVQRFRLRTPWLGKRVRFTTA